MSEVNTRCAIDQMDIGLSLVLAAEMALSGAENFHQSEEMLAVRTTLEQALHAFAPARAALDEIRSEQ